MLMIVLACLMMEERSLYWSVDWRKNSGIVCGLFAVRCRRCGGEDRRGINPCT